jgi:Arc/MetJ-type ribon-helix-helix transcriptional regulator
MLDAVVVVGIDIIHRLNSLDNKMGMMYYHTKEHSMGKAKIAITLDEKTVNRIDRLVQKKAFSNRSQAIEEALQEKLARLDKSRLAREAAKLDPEYERALAEEGIVQDSSEWPIF